MGRQWEERERRNNSQPEQNRISKRMVFRRTVILMLMCGVGFFIPLAVQLWNISIRDHNFYQQKAAEQQLMDVAVAAHRGDILDANGEVMAMSATVYNLILAPKDLINSVDKDDFEDEDGKLDQSAYQAEIQRKRDEVADGLCAVRPDLDRADLERRLEKENSQYEVLLTNVEEGEAEAIRAFIEEHKTAYYLYLTPSTKRYYPFSALASQVLGFVNTEGGVYGLEAGYEDVLKGIPGRVVTGKTAKNVEMYNSYSNYIDAVNGYDLTLTLDSAIQSYCESILKKGIEQFEVQDIETAMLLTEHLADYILTPGISSSQEAALDQLCFIMDREEAVRLIPYVNLFNYGETVIHADNAALTSYGLLHRADYEPMLSPIQQKQEKEMTMQ